MFLLRSYIQTSKCHFRKPKMTQRTKIYVNNHITLVERIMYISELKHEVYQVQYINLSSTHFVVWKIFKNISSQQSAVSII